MYYSTSVVDKFNSVNEYSPQQYFIFVYGWLNMISLLVILNCATI